MKAGSLVAVLTLAAIFPVCLATPQSLQLEYSTYLGGSGNDYANSVAVDNNGFAYITGRESSTNFPAVNSYQSSYGGSLADAFVSKISSTGSFLIYSTYLGGNGTDSGLGISLDSSGCACVTGFSGSSDFPTLNAYQASNADPDYYDVFITKLNPSGSALEFSTYLGGTDHDQGHGISIDSLGQLYLTGDCESSDFPVLNSYQSSFGGVQDAFLVRFASSGSTLLYSTYLGGSGTEQGKGIALDNALNIYLSGVTQSGDFPTINSYQASNADTYYYDVFITKLNPSGTTLIFSTYLGGGMDDINGALAVDSMGCTYLGGKTASSNFPTTNPYQSSLYGNWDAFISKFASSGSVLSYSTYLGGDWVEGGGYLCIDSENCAYLTGETLSNNFPVINAYQSSRNGGLGTCDAFVSKISSTGTTLIYSTFLGGSSDDYGNCIAENGSVYVAGYTQSADFPTNNAYQSTRSGSTDAFIAKLKVQEVVTTPTPPPTATPKPTFTPSPTGTASPTTTPSPSPEITLPPTLTPPPPSPTVTLTPLITPTPSSIPTPSPTVSPTPQPSSTPSPLPTPYNPLDLTYSTFLGGDGTDYGYEIAVDTHGDVYLCGQSNSDNFPVENPYQSSLNGSSSDVFISKFNSSGSTLILSTYLGGTSGDVGRSLAVDSNQRIYITGDTYSNDFPTMNPYQPGGNGTTAFVSKLSSSGSELIYSTYLGGSDYDEGRDIAVDSSGTAYVGGETMSNDFPTANAYQSAFAGSGDTWGDGFVTRISADGSALIYSTYLGGSNNDEVTGITLDSSGTAYITGGTRSVNFPLVAPYQGSRAGADDVFVSLLSSSGSSLIYSTYLGGGSYDYGGKIAVDSGRLIYICGSTASTNFPTVNCYQSSHANIYFGEDAFVSKFTSSGSGLVWSTYLGGEDDDYAKDIGMTAFNDVCVTGHTNSNNFPTRNAYQPYRAGSGDAFLTCISGPRMEFSTYLGGSELDRAHGLSIGTLGDIYITGYTVSSDNFPRRNSYQSVFGGGYCDAFFSRFFFYSTSVPAPWINDYNGDGTSDIAVFRSASGLWAIRNISRLYYGGASDFPVPSDYDGDGTTDIAIFRDSSGLWAVRGISRIYFGSSFDDPQPGDYDGDGTSDIAVFRSTSGLWAIRGVTRVYFGGSNDIPVYWYGTEDGHNGRPIVIYRPASGLWAFRGITRFYFGGYGDIPLGGDFTASGDWKPGIYRSSSGLWAIAKTTRIYYGGGSDTPIPGVYRGNSRDDIGIFRSVSGLWAIRGVTRVYFGGSGDTPVTR